MLGRRTPPTLFHLLLILTSQIKLILPPPSRSIFLSLFSSPHISPLFLHDFSSKAFHPFFSLFFRINLGPMQCSLCGNWAPGRKCLQKGIPWASLGLGCLLRIGCALVSLGLGEFPERGAQVSGAQGDGMGCPIGALLPGGGVYVSCCWDSLGKLD